MKKIVLISALSLGFAVTAGAAVHIPYQIEEQRLAHFEEARIITRPIGGIENHYWFDYRTDIGEAKKELASDLRNASDLEDLRDAWDEYRVELSGERATYVNKMAKQGYRYGTVELTD